MTNDTDRTALVARQRVWTCKIGVMGDLALPFGADAPLRNAVADAFYRLTGIHAEFNFSGWGGSLDENELAVVQDRLPRARPLPDEPTTEGV